MKLDDLLREIGEFGPYQKRVYLLAVLPSILVAAEALSVIFIFYIPKHRCAIPGVDNDTFTLHDDAHAALRNLFIPRQGATWDSCHVYEDASRFYDVNGTSDVVTPPANGSQALCSRWVFDQSEFDSTVATDFDVVCDRSILRAQSTLIAELGTFLGMFISGLLADRFGRKVVFFLSALALFGGGVGIAFSTSLLSLNVCRFVLGWARQSTFVNGLVLGMETVGPSQRTSAGMAIQFSWCIGAFYLCFFAYFIRNWRYLEIAVSVPGVFLFAYWWLLPESPRWLMSSGQGDKAMAIFRKIAESNKTQLPMNAKQLLEKEGQLSVRHVFRSRELIKRMLIVVSNIFVNVLAYYGVTLNITNLSGDIFVNFTLSFVLETLAYAVAIFALRHVGRKVVYLTGILVGGACCIVSILPVMLNAASWLIVALSMVGRFFIIISFSVIYLYGAELFPTVVRSSAIGTCISFSRIANLLSPYLADLGLLVEGRFGDALPLVLMGLPAILVGLLALYLPETRNTTLPETLQDLEDTSREHGAEKCVSPEEQTLGMTRLMVPYAH